MDMSGLKTFIISADTGSFKRAADQSYLTLAAVIKRINKLEAELGVSLFDRSFRGLTLTKSGESLYNDAKYILEYSESAVARAKAAMQDNSNVVRIANTILTPINMIEGLWPKIYELIPDIDIQIKYYDYRRGYAQETMKSLGRDIDLVFWVTDNELMKLRQCSSTDLFRLPLCCALSTHHRLADRERLTIEDLFGEKLMVMYHGWSHSTDQLRRELLVNYPQIQIVDIDFYDEETFNYCERSGNLLVALSSQKSIHPLIRIIPVDWDYSIPFGFAHSPTPPATIKAFLKTAKTISEQCFQWK